MENTDSIKVAVDVAFDRLNDIDPNCPGANALERASLAALLRQVVDIAVAEALARARARARIQLW